MSMVTVRGVVVCVVCVWRVSWTLAFTHYLLHHTNLTTIPDDISQNVTYADLRYNQFDTVPQGRVSDKQSLSVCDLSHNVIHWIHPYAFCGSPLMKLVLPQCSIHIS